jgi:hypothetical protein
MQEFYADVENKTNLRKVDEIFKFLPQYFIAL